MWVTDMNDDQRDRKSSVMGESSLWATSDRSRWFLINGGVTPPAGSTAIRSLSGESALTDLDWLAPFEVTEDQARRWAKDQLGHTLEELKHGIDERLADLRQRLDEKNRTPVAEDTKVTPNAVPALFDLLKKLPGVIGNSLSGENQRVESAKTAMAQLQRRLKEAGIELDERFTNFPDRLADLRKDVEQERAARNSKENETPPEEP